MGDHENAPPQLRPGRHRPSVRAVIYTCVWATLLAAVACRTRTVPVGQQEYIFEREGLAINHLLFLPEGYGRRPAKRWPLIVFLHGSGEQGQTVGDLERLKAQGLPRLIAERPDFADLTARFIVLSPQCPGWYWKSKFDALDALLSDIQERYAVDPQRIYLTGLSMGGFGTWQYAVEHPQWFAALVPLAGAYGYRVETVYVGSGQSETILALDPSPPEALCDLKDVPVWVFHGEKDVHLPHEQTADPLVRALQACGGEVRYTLYPNLGHDVWTDTYDDPALYTWLLEQQRPGN